MEDCLQLLAALGLGEDERAQRPTIELSLRGEHAAAEMCDHRGESGLSGCDHGARGIVSIDDRNAELPETLLYRALAACDSAREADAQAPRHAQCRNPDTRK